LIIDNFGDRMKAYEEVESARVLDPRLPVYVRLDGRAFSTFTRGLPRPFYEPLSKIMVDVTKLLVDKTHADIGYTQSDEISLGWFPKESEQLLFAGRIQKLTSTLAGTASSAFALLCTEDGIELEHRAWDLAPSFDARVYQPPSEMELINSFVWREHDCSRNAISMTAQSLYTHKQLQGMKTERMLEMIAEKGLEYESLPEFFRKGSYVKRISREVPMPDTVPEQYRTSDTVQRTFIEVCDRDWTTTAEQLAYFKN